MLMKAAKFCKQKCYFLAFFCPADDPVAHLLILLYSYFEKGCQKKCTRQSRKAFWVVLSSLLFREIGHLH